MGPKVSGSAERITQYTYLPRWSEPLSADALRGRASAAAGTARSSRITRELGVVTWVSDGGLGAMRVAFRGAAARGLSGGLLFERGLGFGVPAMGLSPGFSVRAEYGERLPHLFEQSLREARLGDESVAPGVHRAL